MWVPCVQSLFGLSRYKLLCLRRFNTGCISFTRRKSQTFDTSFGLSGSFPEGIKGFNFDVQCRITRYEYVYEICLGKCTYSVISCYTLHFKGSLLSSTGRKNFDFSLYFCQNCFVKK